MNDKRAELIKRNKNFIQIPMPNLSEMTNEALEKRVNMFERLFEMEFDDDIEEGNK